MNLLKVNNKTNKTKSTNATWNVFSGCERRHSKKKKKKKNLADYVKSFYSKFCHNFPFTFLCFCSTIEPSHELKRKFGSMSKKLCEKCPNAEFFLVGIFLYSDRYSKSPYQSEYREIRTRKRSVFRHFWPFDPEKNFLRLIVKLTKFCQIFVKTLPEFNCSKPKI